MRKLFGLLLLCPLLFACAPAVENPFIGDFSCTVSFSIGETAYLAEYARQGGWEKMILRAPETLCGLTAVREGTEITVTLGELTFTPLAGERLFDFTAVLRPRPLTCTAAEDGYRLHTEGYTLHTDSAGCPLSLESGRYSMHFIRFERRKAE